MRKQRHNGGALGPRPDAQTNAISDARQVKGSDDVAAKLAAVGCDPIEGLVRIAASGDTPAKLRRKTYLTLSEFAFPKERAISILRRLLLSPRPEELFG